jgi:outer membrane receptor protein involved in Fe transport
MFSLTGKRLFVISLFLVCVCASALAQGAAKISGTVKDSAGALVPGATVTALNIASSQRFTATTDSSGKYEIANLPSGNYRVIATAQGFGESAENVGVDGGASVTQDFSIAPGAIRDVVTVTAGKGTERLAIETPQTVSVTSADQIEQRVPRSTFEAIERAPNLTALETNPARERPRLRGLASTRLLVLIDGEKLNNARSDPGASGAPIAIIDPSQLESVEVVGGSGSSLYGSDAIAGTINLITKSPPRPDAGAVFGARLDGNYSSNGEVRRGNLTATLANSQFAFRASGNLYRNANYTTGDGAVTVAQNVAFGEFFRRFPTNAAGTTFQSAASYVVFNQPRNAEILNGQGHGGGFQFDLWFYPSAKHNLRGRFIGRDEGNNGNAFSGPPYETQERYTAYRDFNKGGVRYEGLGLIDFIPRVSVNVFSQKISSPQNQYTFVNTAGATGSYLNATTFTGLPSLLNSGVAGASYVDNRNSIRTTGVDAQATISPLRGFFATVGGGQTKDRSQDYFFSSAFSGFGPNRIFTGAATIGASSPVTEYKDNNFYVQGEFDRVKWFRLTAGYRYDRWITRAVGGSGFPLSTEVAALNAATPGLTANPGNLRSLVEALPGLNALVAGTGASGTNRGSNTGNIGIVGRLPWGVNPYFRYANSYREPGITERYLIRNFTPGLFLASLVVGNPNLRPETSQNYDTGVKVQQKYFNFSFGYFRNALKDFLVFAPAQNYCVAPVPGIPGSPAAVGFGCAAGQSVISINARINQGAAIIKGFESTAEASLPLGDLGSVNPFYTLGTLRGTNKNPVAQQLAALNLLYNRSDTPIRLEGSATDFPLAGITPVRFQTGAQFLSRSGRFFAEYSLRHQNRVVRSDPNQFIGTALINVNSFLNNNPFTKHSVKGGYNWRNDQYKFSLTAGIDNINDKFFIEHFNTAPAPGRSFVFGFTTEVFNLLRK